jgi:hypothetical protein
VLQVARVSLYAAQHLAWGRRGELRDIRPHKLAEQFLPQIADNALAGD